VARRSESTLKKLLLTTAFLIGLCGTASAEGLGNTTEVEFSILHGQIEEQRAAIFHIETQMEIQRGLQHDADEARKFKDSLKLLPPLEPSPTPLGLR
jgi:hypothetical protein